jgi:hypothetical protein
MSTHAGHNAHHPTPVMAGAPCPGTRYRIRVRGVLGTTLRTAFPQLEAAPADGETLLTGSLPDQAALYGVLGEIEALGLQLIEVRCEDGRP